jgi:hypothetical protein
LPVPLDGTVIQPAELEAVHVQPLPEVMPMLKLPPAAVADWLVDEREKAQPSACVTEKVALPLPEPTVIEPLCCGPVLAFTVNPALPFPVPVWP